MKIDVTTNERDDLGLHDMLQRYAGEFWLPGHASDSQAASMILDSFRRKIGSELKLVEVCLRNNLKMKHSNDRD